MMRNTQTRLSSPTRVSGPHGTDFNLIYKLQGFVLSQPRCKDTPMLGSFERLSECYHGF